MPARSFTINYAGDSTRIEVSREKFEELTSDLVAKTTNFIHALLGKTGLSADDIDTVLLVGGSTRMPMIKEAVDALFTGGKVRREDPDQAVAKGVSSAAAIEWNVIVDEVARTTNVGGDDGGISTDDTPMMFLRGNGIATSYVRENAYMKQQKKPCPCHTAGTGICAIFHLAIVRRRMISLSAPE